MNKRLFTWTRIFYFIALLLSGLVIFTMWPPPLGIDLAGGFRFVVDVDYEAYTPREGERPLTRAQLQDQALEVLRNRIDSVGTREAVVYKEEASGRIVFEIPGVGQAERDSLVDLILRPAYLEFRLVHEDNDRLVSDLFNRGIAPPGFEIVTLDGARYFQEIQGYERPDNWREQVAATGRVSPLYELMLERVRVDTLTGLFRPVYVGIQVRMEGTAVTRARPEPDQFGRIQVALNLDNEGARLFARITRDYGPRGANNPSDVGRRLAIVMDDTLYSAPTINTPILGGQAVITGGFTMEEAATLANALNSGSLSAPVRIDTEQSVQPTLGRESVVRGFTAAGAGLVVVMVFMMVYYRLAGGVVNLSLLVDAFLLPLGAVCAAGFLGAFGAGGGAGGAGVNALPTLTLPGIAGLVLTIGMAVDANVLIFERIREEQNAGKRFVSAIQSGYEKVFSTIFDANITTLLVAVILFLQGSGPIRGFAVMLTAGIIVSMPTALIFTRFCFDLVAETGKVQKLKMMSLVPDGLNIDFINKRFIALAISGVLLLGALVNMGIKGRDVLGIDFLGGASMQFTYIGVDANDPSLRENPDQVVRPSVSEIQALLREQGVQESVVQYQVDVAGFGADIPQNRLQVNVASEFADLALETLTEAFGESHEFDRVAFEQIGPQVGRQMQRQGFFAILFALIGIVIYVTFRFEFAFAMGTIAALAHDVLLTVGLFTLLGGQLSLPIVAALLTIVGYSANDTIVVFDRIREDLKLLKGKPYKEIANISINQTLGRTLLTSVTTLLTVGMLLIFGGGAIRDFALALFIGVIVGTYSSVFVATPVMLLWHTGEKTAKA